MAKTTEAQKRASAKYNREKMASRTLRFSPAEADILAHLDAQPNKAGYIKRLIREDMEREGFVNVPILGVADCTK